MFQYDKHNKYHRAGRTALLTVFSLTLFVIVWWVLAILVNTAAVPTPAKTFDALIKLINEGDPMTGLSLTYYIKSSMGTFLKGFGLAFLVALPLGLLLGTFATAREIATPIIEILRPIAPIAWAPIFLLAINYTVGPILVVTVGIFFPLLTNIIFGVTKIDHTLVDAAKTLGASGPQIFVKILIPSTIPYVMNGIKIGLGIGWMCIVAAEMFATNLAGVGFFVANMANFFRWPYAYAGIIVIAVLGLLTTGVAEYIHKLVSRRMGIDA